MKAPEPIVWRTKILNQEFKSEVLSFREIHQQRNDFVDSYYSNSHKLCYKDLQLNMNV